MFKTALYSALLVLASSTASLASSTEEAFFKLKATQPEGKFTIRTEQDGYSSTSSFEINITISAGQLIIPEDYCLINISNFSGESTVDRGRYIPAGYSSTVLDIKAAKSFDDLRGATIQPLNYKRVGSGGTRDEIMIWLLMVDLFNGQSEGSRKDKERSPVIANEEAFFIALKELWQECKKL